MHRARRPGRTTHNDDDMRRHHTGGSKTGGRSMATTDWQELLDDLKLKIEKTRALRQRLRDATSGLSPLSISQATALEKELVERRAAEREAFERWNTGK